MKTIKHVLSRMAIGLALFGIGIGIFIAPVFFPKMSFGLFVGILVLGLAYCLGRDVLDR